MIASTKRLHAELFLEASTWLGKIDIGDRSLQDRWQGQRRLLVSGFRRRYWTWGLILNWLVPLGRQLEVLLLTEEVADVVSREPNLCVVGVHHSHAFVANLSNLSNVVAGVDDVTS